MNGIRKEIELWIENAEKEVKKIKSYESIIRVLTFATKSAFIKCDNGANIFTVDEVTFHIFNKSLDMVTIGVHTYYADNIYTAEEIKNINILLNPIFDTMMEMRELTA